MSRESTTPTDESNSAIGEWSRRAVLRVTGAGVAAAGLGSAAGLGAAQEGDDDDDDNGDDGSSGGGQGGDGHHLVQDLIDPTWGYPLAANETDDVAFDTVVELVTEEGEGTHPNFPAVPEGTEAPPGEFYFDPVGVHVAPDSVVEFACSSGEHTATAIHEKFGFPRRVPEGVAGFTSPPIVGGESWLYQFPTSGVYDIICLPHVEPGMVMRVVVSDPESDDDDDDDGFSAQPTENLPPNVAAVFGAPELDPAAIVEQGTVAWADLTLGGQ